MFLQSGTIFRSFASQKEFSFDLSITPYNSSGEINVGFSGNNQYSNFFKFKNGRIYDSSNKFVYSYSKKDIVNLSGNYNNGALDYYINNNLIAINLPASTSSNYFDNILLSSNSTAFEFDSKIYGGAVPSYNFSFNNFLPSTGQNISGSVVNNSSQSWQNFKIFSGSAIFNYTGYKFNNGSLFQKLNRGESGNFSLDYSGNGSDYSMSAASGIKPLSYNIDLYTNFGIINKTGIIELGYQPLYFLDFYEFQSGVINNNYSWEYLLEGKLCTGSDFLFKVERVSGFDYVNTTTGQFPVSGIASGLVSGELIGAGFLNGFLSGDLYSNTYDFYGSRLVKSGFQIPHSGNYTYETGYIDATGYKQINSFSGAIFGNGHIDVIYNDILKSRTIDYRDGQYLYSSGNSYARIATGITDSKLTGEFYEYYIPGKIFLPNTTAVNIPITGVFSGKNITSLQYSGFVLGSGSISSDTNYTLNYTGIFTGEKTDGAIVTGYFTSGVAYSSSLKIGASASGVPNIRNYSDFVFSGQDSFYINTGNSLSGILSGRYLLKGLTGNFSFTPNTSSGTSGVNRLLSGSGLPVNMDGLFGYSPCFQTYPESDFDNTFLPSGYLITSNLTSTINFDPAFKNVLGDPIHLNDVIGFYWWGTDDKNIYVNSNLLENSYIRISFNDGVVGSGLVCNSYCIAPHALYPSPSDWSVSGSNDEINWILLDRQSGQNLEKGYLKIYDINNSTFYRHLNFQIDKTDDPYFHIPRVQLSEILDDSYKRGLGKFNFLNRVPLRYLTQVDRSIPFIDINSPLKNNISVSQVSTDEWNYGKHRAFDNDLNSETWIFNANTTTNSTNNRGVIINQNLANTGVVSLNDFSQAAEITEAAFNDTYNFYGGSFNTFMGQARSNFAVTNKNNTISSNGVYSFSNQVRLIEATGSRVVVSSQGQTRFLTGLSLSTLNTNLYTNSLFTAAEPSSADWKVGGSFPAQYDVDRTTLFTTGLQNTNGKDYILNNGLIYTNLSGNLITGFPLVRNWSGFSQPNWEMGVDSDGYSQLRYNLHYENNDTQLGVGVSGIISHDLFIPQLNQTKRVTYIYGNFSTSKFFKGRGSTDNSSNQLVNPQGRNIYCQRMATGRDSILNYEFPNSGITAGIESMQIDSFGGNLICMGSFDNIGNIPNNLKRKMVFYSLPNESRQIPIAQDLRNEYNGFTGVGQTGLVSGGFVMKRNPEFYADNTILTSCLSGSSGLFIGGDFSNPRIPASVPTPFSNGRAILINISGNNQSGVIVTGYNVNGTVRAMDFDNQGNIHLGGDFSSASLSTRNRYARYNALTAQLQPLDLNFNNSVYGLLCDRVNNTLWVGGDFTTINGGTITRNRAARINLTNNQVEAWNVGNGFNGRVKGIITGFNNDLIFYGSFSQFSGINCRGVAKFTSAGSFITGGADLRRASDNFLYDNNATPGDCEIDPVDRSIYLTFIGNSSWRGDQVDGTDFNYNYRRIIRYNYDTLKPSGVAPNFTYGYPRSIKYWNDRLIIGGDNFSIGYGQFTEGIAAFINEPTGQILTTFNPHLNGIVRSACKVSDGLILAGAFDSCHGVFRSGLAKIDFYGNIITGFNPTCQNPDIIEIKNTPSGVFALTSKSWNPDTPGHFYRINPSNGALLENYSFNISESAYSNGDFFIDNTPSSIGHVVISNVKNYNPEAFIEYTFPNTINSIQGYRITFTTGLNPDSFSFMASGITGGLYQVIDSRGTPGNSGVTYLNYNINYPLSGIKKVKFQFNTKNKIGIKNIDIYTKESESNFSLRLNNLRGSGFATGSSIPNLMYVTGHVYEYSEDAYTQVDGVYKKTGYIDSGNYSRINIFGDYRASLAFGKTIIDIASGESEINKIKIPEVTGSNQSELNLKLKFGFQNYLTSNSDMFNININELNDFTQEKLTFYYKNGSDYSWWQNDQFDTIETFVDKLNNNFSDYLTGSYNSTTRDLKLKLVQSIGHSGNMVYFQPVIKSGLNNFLQQDRNYDTNSFYFSGGETYYKNFDTGVSGFNSGVFSLGSLNPAVYFHKKEYRNINKNINSGVVSLYDKRNFFTGAIGLGYIPINSYSSYTFATGRVEYLYNVNLTGWASGWNPRTNSSGIVTGIIKRVGMLSDNAVSGFGPWMNKSFTGVGSAGSVYVIPRTGGGYIEVSNYWSGYFTGVFDFKVPKTGFYSQITGVPVLLNTGFDWINYDANFKYNFDIKTGAWSNDGSVRYSGVSINYDPINNYYYGTGKIDSTTCLPLVENKSKFVLFEMNHYNPYNSGNNIMKYSVSGLSGSYLFTGLIKE